MDPGIRWPDEHESYGGDDMCHEWVEQTYPQVDHDAEVLWSLAGLHQKELLVVVVAAAAVAVVAKAADLLEVEKSHRDKYLYSRCLAVQKMHYLKLDQRQCRGCLRT